MRFRWRRWSVFLLCASLLMFILLLPGLPWAARLRHTLRRTVVKGEMTLARWRGHEPRLASLTGRVNIPGAQVEALDSRSGWATLSDHQGYFILPDVVWYPFATYELVISTDGEKGKIVSVTAPERLPENGMFETEMINLEPGGEVDLSRLMGVNAITLMGYDDENTQYYKDLFDKLTAGKETDDERIDAANQYVATKLSYEETPWDVGSPRRVLESGSQYCGHLSGALATLLATGEYRTRQIDLTDGKSPPYTHVAVEVFYDGGWHLYDPTYGVRFVNKHGKVASYKDVRLDPSMITEDLFVRFPTQKRIALAALLPSLYGSGFHHFYCFKNR